jgi:MFS family permease
MATEPKSANTQEALGHLIERIPITRIHYFALFLVVTGGLFEVLEQLILSALGPALQDAFGIGAQDLAFLSTATLLAIVVGGVLGGYLADKIGRRGVLAISVGIYSLGSILSAVAPDYTVLALARVVTGIGVGGEIAVGLTYLSELTPTKIRGLFVSLFNTISAGVGMFVAYAYALFVLGPFAALIGAGENGWRWAFGLLGIPAVLVFFLRRYLPETPRYLMERGHVHKLNDSLTRLARGRLRLRRDEQPTAYFDPADSESIEAAARAVSAPKVNAFGALFEARQRTRTIGLSVAAFLAWGAQFSVIILMPLLLVDRGYSIGGSLTFTMVQNIGGLLGAIVASIGAYAFPRRRMILIGTIMAALSVIMFALFATTPALVMILGFLFQFCVMLVNTTIWTWAPELFPTKIRGLGTAVVVNIGFLGGALIPLSSAWFYENVNEFSVFAGIAVMYVMILLASRFVTETHNVPFEKLHGPATPAPHQTVTNPL